MMVMDSFAATGRDAIVTGRVTSGKVSVGDTICLVPREQGSKQYVVGGIAKSGKEVESVAAPNMVGIELKGLDAKSLKKEDGIRHRITLRASC